MKRKQLKGKLNGFLKSKMETITAMAEFESILQMPEKAYFIPVKYKILGKEENLFQTAQE